MVLQSMFVERVCVNVATLPVCVLQGGEGYGLTLVHYLCVCIYVLMGGKD